MSADLEETPAAEEMTHAEDAPEEHDASPAPAEEEEHAEENGHAPEVSSGAEHIAGEGPYPLSGTENFSPVSSLCDAPPRGRGDFSAGLRLQHTFVSRWICCSVTFSASLG